MCLSETQCPLLCRFDLFIFVFDYIPLKNMTSLVKMIFTCQMKNINDLPFKLITSLGLVFLTFNLEG
jgi:hypothetical protein